MAGLTAPPDNTAQAGQVIAADGWFPGIDTGEVRKRIRLGEGSVTEDRLKEAVIGAILSGLKALSVWRTARALEGKGDLQSVTEDQVAGQNVAVILWQRVIVYYAAAELLDGHTDVAATDDALDREDQKRLTADSYRRKAYEAVADLRAIGAPDGTAHGRNRVDLI